MYLESCQTVMMELFCTNIERPTPQLRTTFAHICDKFSETNKTYCNVYEDYNTGARMKDELGYLQKAVRKSLLCFSSDSFIANTEKYHLNTGKYHFSPLKAQRQVSKVLKSKIKYSKSIVYLINHANFELHREYSDRVNWKN